MTNFKLTYFDSMGRAEVIRAMFNYRDVAFEDERISHEDWLKIKETFAFKQLPMLTINGTDQLFESRAIELFIAKELGLMPTSNLDQAKVAQFILNHDSLYVHWSLLFEKDEEVKEVANKEFLKNHVLPFLFKYNECLKSNQTSYLVADTLTLADFAFYQIVFAYINTFKLILTDDLYEIKKFMSLMESDPKYQVYLKQRKITAY
uniref:Glutathione transferase n=1 Tax=Rhabditophanes sp. KR3021 TaxID=114890 RepID=A0AC35UF48_9BILA